MKDVNKIIITKPNEVIDLGTEYLIPRAIKKSSNFSGYFARLNYETTVYTENIKKELGIYLPDGYSDSEKYNVLYFVHDNKESIDDYLSKDSLKMLNSLYGLLEKKNTIIVFISYYFPLNKKNKKELKKSGNIPSSDGIYSRSLNNFYEEILKDIIPLVELSYSTNLKSSKIKDITKTRNNRSIMGLSRGAKTVIDAFLNSNNAFYFFAPVSLNSDDVIVEEIVEYISNNNNDYFLYFFSSQNKDLSISKDIVSTLINNPKIEFGKDSNEANLYYSIFKDKYSSSHFTIYLYNVLSLIFKEEKISQETKEIEEEEDLEEKKIVYDKFGRQVIERKNKSFNAKLILSSSDLKNYYTTLKNALLSIDKANSRLSWSYDSFNVGRLNIAKLNIRGKSLCLFLALDKEDFNEGARIEWIDKKKYESTKCLIRIKSEYKLKRAQNLISFLKNKYNLLSGEKKEFSFFFPKKTEDELISEGEIKITKNYIGDGHPYEDIKAESDTRIDLTIEYPNGSAIEKSYLKSFYSRLVRSNNFIKGQYEILKNMFLTCEALTSTMSYSFDNILENKKKIAKFDVRDGELRLYLALDLMDISEKYRVEVTESKNFSDCPILFRIKSQRKAIQAVDLIALLIKKYDYRVLSDIRNDKFVFNYSIVELAQKGYIKELSKKDEESVSILIKELEDEQVVEAAPLEDEQREVIPTPILSDDTTTFKKVSSTGEIIVVRLDKSFTAKLIQADDLTKGYYTTLKNKFLSYDGIKDHLSWSFDSIKSGWTHLSKFSIRGKTLMLYLALDSKEIDPKYKVEIAKEKKYEMVPTFYRIKNKLRLKYALELIEQLMNKYNIPYNLAQNKDYYQEYDTTNNLIERKLIREKVIGGKQEDLKRYHEDASSKKIKEFKIEKKNEPVKSKEIKYRYNKSFIAKLIQAKDETKIFYSDLKNYILSSKKVKSHISWNYDSINKGREKLAKFSIKGKTLYLYLNLENNDLGEKYKVEFTKAKKYSDTKCLYRIKNKLRLKYAKELIDILNSKFNVERLDKLDITDYYLPYRTTETLIKKKLIKKK